MEKESEEKTTKKDTKTTTTKTSTHAGRYLIIGIILTVFSYILYTILSNVIIKDNNLIWLSTLIGTTITALLAYILHSKITWKERTVTKTAKYKFFIWNLALAFIISPSLTQIFSFATPLYKFAFSITEFLHLPFSYDFVLTTGAFVLATTITTVLNFFFYDKFVFGKTKE